MKVLVTGGAGFIGSHLCDALVAREYQVWCIDNLHLGCEENISHLKSKPNFIFQKIDVLNAHQMDQLFGSVGFDMVFHMAANSDIQAGSRDHGIDMRLTFLTTYEVLECMFKHGVKKIFFASTSAIFGEAKAVLHEEYGPLRPISFYGAAKLAAESYLSVFANNYGFRVWVLRFPNVVGERCTHGAIHDFIARLKENPKKLIVLGDGTQKKPYLYVEDLVDAMLTVFDKAPLCNLAIYNVGNQSQTTVKRMAEIVREEMELHDSEIEYTGGDRGWIGDVPVFEYNMDKIKSLGFRQSLTSEEAVRHAVRRILDRK